MNYFYITGTSRGIGKSIAVQLLKKKQSFIIGISRTCTIVHPNYKHFTLDLNDFNQVKDFKFDIHKNTKSITFINNSGVLGDIKQVGKIDSNSIISTFNINTISPAILMNKFVEAYQKEKIQRVILNISSGAGRYPIKSWSSYCASKSALDMFSDVIFNEQGILENELGIKVFSIAPGIIDTQMQDEIREVAKEDFEDLDTFINYKKENLLIPPQEIASQLIKIIENPDNYNQAILDVRGL